MKSSLIRTAASPSVRWFEVSDVAAIFSPALLIYRERVIANVRRMIELAGDPERLRPHIKTHKMREMVLLQKEFGITKFKCATIAEAEMAAECGVPDLLVAYQPVGPNLRRFARLVTFFPQTAFSVVVDDPTVAQGLSAALRSWAQEQGIASGVMRPIEVLVDLDVGQHRTGIAASEAAVDLYRRIGTLPGLKPGGLHAYDGHIHDPDPATRARQCESAFVPVEALRQHLKSQGLPVPRVVAGGAPTFAFHAQRSDVECSPGTCVFWDAGYASKFPEMDFEPAALLLTRVVSKPSPERLCVDLGHKAVASEMPHPRVKFLELPDATAMTHSEEHLVIQTSRAPEFRIGDCLYGIPWHICPTVALHAEAVVVEQGKIVARWPVAARSRQLTI